MALDKDLQSIQEMRDLVQKAKQAQLEFRAYDQVRVDRIVKAMADAGFDAAERLGRMAHEETGFGKPEDKRKKNEFATRREFVFLPLVLRFAEAGLFMRHASQSFGGIEARVRHCFYDAIDAYLVV